MRERIQGLLRNSAKNVDTETGIKYSEDYAAFFRCLLYCRIIEQEAFSLLRIK